MTQATLVTLFLALSAGAAHAAAQDAPSPSEAPVALHMEGERARLPFRLDGPLPIPVVEVTIEGRGPFRFYVDTGAGITVLDDGLIDELGLSVVGSMPLGDPSASARIDARKVLVEQLELGGVVLEGFHAAGMDGNRFGGGGVIRGVLGLPLFRDRLLTIDYAEKQLVLQEAELLADGEHVIPYTPDGGPPKVTLQAPGRACVVAIDTGSPASFSLPAAVCADLSWIDEPVVIGMARTVNSEFEVRQGKLDGALRIGGHAFENPTVRIDDHFPHGNVGYEILKDFALTIDQRNARMRLTRNAKSPRIKGGPRRVVRANAPAGRRKLGAMMVPDGKQLKTTGVVPGSAAETAGLRVGDVLVAVDGRPMSFDDPKPLHEALAGTAAIRLTVERNGERIELIVPGL